MAKELFTWQEGMDSLIMLVNRTKQNFILELPSGRYRLDAGRSMRTTSAITKIPQVQALISDGTLDVEFERSA